MASLRYVFGEVGAELGVDDHRFEAWIAALEQAGRPDPRVHALFHAIVADMQGGALDRAVFAATKLLALGAASDQLTIHPLQRDVDDAWPVALFSRFADIEQSNRLDFTAPHPGVTPRFERLIDQGLNLIARHDPALDGELRALLSDILIVAQAPSRQFVTAAVSCFQNWGGLLFNPSAQRDELDIVETLAHEATHLTLFALALVRLGRRAPENEDPVLLEHELPLRIPS